MPSLLLLILLSSLSIKACNGRDLSFAIKDSTVSSHDLNKDVDKGSSLLKPLKTGLEVAKMKREAISSGTAVIKIVPYSHIGLPKTVKSKVGPGKRLRALLGFPTGEETVVADFVAMDYQRPRGGPSIHNR